MRKTIFITGSTGFIGNSLIQRSTDSRIYSLIRGREDHNDDRVTNFHEDILNSNAVTSILERIKCETVFHCAAYISFKKKDFNRAYKVNVEGTRNVMEAAYRAGVRKVVHLSACATLGWSTSEDRILDETSEPVINKGNVYGYTKKIAEEEVRKYVEKGLNVSIANIATVYGRGDKKLNSGTIIKSIYQGKIRFAPPGGTSFVSVDDLVDGLLLLAEKGRPGERYIFCTENMGYDVLFQRIARTLKVSEPRYKLPRFTYYPALLAVKGLESVSKNNLMSSQILNETYGYKYYSSEKAKTELDWKPKQSFEVAVQKAFDYYRQKNLI